MALATLTLLEIVLGIDNIIFISILVGGGLFLLAKSTHEIHGSLEGEEDSHETAKRVSFGAVLVQIALLDIVFSLDSVITAVGLAEHVSVMIIAIVISVGIMMWASGPIAGFVERHPTIKMLALSFLVLLGFTQVAEGFGAHIPKAYIYFAMAFSFLVEMLNLRARKVRNQVKLRNPNKAKL